MTPLNYQCRRCWAAVSEACVNPDGSPVLVSGKPWFHAERYEDAESQEVEGANISKEEFEKSINDSGLI
jgi:hypothetical protein